MAPFSQLICHGTREIHLDILILRHPVDQILLDKSKRQDPAVHDIKILNVDETENVRFMVYGYMNRGMHEGSIGVQVCEYNGMLNTVEELICATP